MKFTSILLLPLFVLISTSKESVKEGAVSQPQVHGSRDGSRDDAVSSPSYSAGHCHVDDVSCSGQSGILDAASSEDGHQSDSLWKQPSQEENDILLPDPAQSYKVDIVGVLTPVLESHVIDSGSKVGQSDLEVSPDGLVNDISNQHINTSSEVTEEKMKDERKDDTLLPSPNQLDQVDVTNVQTSVPELDAIDSGSTEVYVEQTNPEVFPDGPVNDTSRQEISRQEIDDQSGEVKEENDTLLTSPVQLDQEDVNDVQTPVPESDGIEPVSTEAEQTNPEVFPDGPVNDTSRQEISRQEISSQEISSQEIGDQSGEVKEESDTFLTNPVQLDQVDVIDDQTPVQGSEVVGSQSTDAGQTKPEIFPDGSVNDTSNQESDGQSGEVKEENTSNQESDGQSGEVKEENDTFLTNPVQLDQVDVIDVHTPVPESDGIESVSTEAEQTKPEIFPDAATDSIFNYISNHEIHDPLVEIKEEDDISLPNPVQLDQVDINPVQLDQVDINPVQLNQVDTNPVQLNQVDTNPVQLNQVDTNPVQLNQVDTNPVQLSQVDTIDIQTPVPESEAIDSASTEVGQSNSEMLPDAVSDGTVNDGTVNDGTVNDTSNQEVGDPLGEVYFGILKEYLCKIEIVFEKTPRATMITLVVGVLYIILVTLKMVLRKQSKESQLSGNVSILSHPILTFFLVVELSNLQSVIHKYSVERNHYNKVLNAERQKSQSLEDQMKEMSEKFNAYQDSIDKIKVRI